MTQTISLPPAHQDGYITRLWKDPDQRSILMGIVGVILVHLFLAVLAPWLFKTEPTHFTKRKQAQPQVFNIEMAPELFPKTVKPPPMKFVQANPNAPENTPDKTNNFSDRNQQVAQEKPQKDAHSDMPATEGRTDMKSNAIVTGMHSPPQEAVPPSPPQAVKTPSVAKPKAEQAPLAGLEKTTGNDVDGFKSNNSKAADVTKDVTQTTKGSKDTPVIQDANMNEATIDPKRPRARPALARSNLQSVVLSQNTIGTHNVGITALDSRFNNYGTYLTRLFGEIEAQWYKILEPMNFAPFQGTHVMVKFRLNSKGEVEELVATDSTAPDPGTRACQSAITMPAPYDKWTPDMIAMLGTEQELVVTFYYE